MSTKDRRLREKEQRRLTILDTAERIFAEKGFEATVMADIAEEAELSKGTLYLYFEGKEELAFAIFQKNIAGLKQMIEEASASKTLGLEKIQVIFQAYLRFYREHFQKAKDGGGANHFYLNRVFEYYFQPREGNELAKRSFEGIEGILEILVEAAKTGMADGSIRPDLDPQKAAVTFGNLVLIYMLRLSQGQDLMLQGHGFSAEELLNYAFSLFRDSLKPG